MKIENPMKYISRLFQKKEVEERERKQHLDMSKL